MVKENGKKLKSILLQFNMWPFDLFRKNPKQSKVILPAQKTKRISKIGQPAPHEYLVKCEIVYKGMALSTVDLKIKAPTAAIADKLVIENVELRPAKVNRIKTKH